MTWSHLGVERISSGRQWRQCIAGGWKIQNGKWRFGTDVLLMIGMNTTALRFQVAVGKAKEPALVHDRNLVGQFNLTRATRFRSQTMTKEP
jgi:hypothetical protein